MARKRAGRSRPSKKSKRARRRLIPRRPLVILLVVAALVVAGEYAAAPTARRYLLAEMERATGLSPSVARVSLSLWRGAATAHDVEVPNPKPFREPILLRARSVTVNLALLPLFYRQVVVQKIALRGAEIVVERNRRGYTNVQAFVERLKARRGKTSRGGPIRVDKLSLADSTVLYIDNSSGPYPAKVRLEDVQVVVRDIDSARAFDPLYTRFNAEAAVATPRRGRLVAEGRTNPFNPSVNFDLRLTFEGLDLPVLQRLYPASPVVILEGLADLYTSATCRSYRLSARNRLVLHRLNFRPRGQASQVAGLPIQTVLAFLQKEDRIELEFDVTGDVRNPRANLQPAVERFIARALQHKILGAPEEIVRAGKKGVSASTKALEAGKKAGGVLVEGAKRLGSGLKRLFGR